MEAPLSAMPGTAIASTATVNNAASHAIHKRQQSSKNGLTPAAASTVSLFVANLRLLDLDLQPEWPNVTVHSFGNQDARNRIKCTEHALYHLFRLHDPTLAADKLQPFFPPLEPMQSVNLRAALFRCLTELKKSGVLPRETIVRKTMLDECSGDKFWEVCLSFSGAVLRKRALAKKSKRGSTTAHGISTASSLSAVEKESLIPLAIAHKAALHKSLREKQRKYEVYTNLHDLLVEKSADLRQRGVTAQKRSLIPVSTEKLKAIEKTVEREWIGSVELKDALINGDVCTNGDGILLRSFDGLWKSREPDSDAASCVSTVETGFLQALCDNVQEQNRRLRKLQSFHETLLASKPRPVQSSNRNSTTIKPTVRFNCHRELTVRKPPYSPGSESPPTPFKHERHDSVLRYDEILSAMREELRRNMAGRDHSAPPPPLIVQPVRRAQTQPVLSHRASMNADVPLNSPSMHKRTPSQTAVPVRPRIGSRGSSRSRSYQQPKVSGQREPIPLKTEIFSPLKDVHRRSISGASVLASPAEGDEPPSDAEYAQRESTRNSESIKPATPTCDASSDVDSIGLGNDVNGLSLDDSSSRSSATSIDLIRTSLTGNVLFDKPMVMDSPISEGTRVFARPSLAERTRMSMLPSQIDTSQVAESSKATEPYGSRKEGLSTDEDSEPLAAHTFASLAERTRQSISLAPQPVSITNEPSKITRSALKSHRQSTAPLYPINQFVTPQKPRARFDLDDNGTTESEEDEIDGYGARRNATPLAHLLSPEADYDSVFKSRPRIAVSPRASLSPERGNSDVAR